MSVRVTYCGLHAAQFSNEKRADGTLDWRASLEMAIVEATHLDSFSSLCASWNDLEPDWAVVQSTYGTK